MNEHDSYELRRIRRESEKQTTMRASGSIIGLGTVLICVALVIGGAIGILLGIVGVLFMILPILVAVGIAKEGLDDAKKMGELEKKDSDS